MGIKKDDALHKFMEQGWVNGLESHVYIDSASQLLIPSPPLLTMFTTFLPLLLDWYVLPPLTIHVISWSKKILFSPPHDPPLLTTVIYYSISWTCGGYLVTTAPFFPFNTQWIWDNYPHIQLPLEEKAFYLCQMAFWIHMVFVTIVEEHRKDYVMMMTHHMITNFLVIGSYCTNFTLLGNSTSLYPHTHRS